VFSLPPPSTTSVSLETGAAAYSDMAFQMWTFSVEWWERERAAHEQGAYLNMMMLSMKVAQRVVSEQMVKEMRWVSLTEMR
jgi:hypothetical protein